MGPDIGRILKNIADYKATMFFAPPTVWIGMLRHPDFSKYDLSSLVKCYYGASIMPKEILRELLEKFPKAGVYNYYGQTELVSPTITILKAEDAMAKIGFRRYGRAAYGNQDRRRRRTGDYRYRRVRRNLRPGGPTS